MTKDKLLGKCHSRNRLTGGAGIEFSIVKAIVEAHRGSIHAESMVGEGTSFRISLPKKKIRIFRIYIKSTHLFIIISC